MKNVNKKIILTLVILMLPLIAFLAYKIEYHSYDSLLLPKPIPDGLFVEEVVTDIDVSDRSSEYFNLGQDQFKLYLGEDDDGNPVEIRAVDNDDNVKFYFTRKIGERYYSSGYKLKSKSEIWPYLQSKLITVRYAKLKDFSGNKAKILLKATPRDLLGALVFILLIVVVLEAYMIYYLFRKWKEGK